MIVAMLGPPLLAGLYFGVRYVLSNEIAQFVVLLVALLALREVFRPGMTSQE